MPEHPADQSQEGSPAVVESGLDRAVNSGSAAAASSGPAVPTTSRPSPASAAPSRPPATAAPGRPPAWRRASTWRHRGRVVQAMGLLAAGGALQKWVPMERWSGLLGEHGPVPPAWQGAAVVRLPARADGPVERTVAIAVHSGSRWLPWKPTCLAEATAGQVMLRRRGEPGVVVIGLRPNDTAKWDAHAWLLGRRGVLTGGPAAQGFTPTTVFEFPGELQAEDVDLSVPAPAPGTGVASGSAPGTGVASGSAPGTGVASGSAPGAAAASGSAAVSGGSAA